MEKIYICVEENFFFSKFLQCVKLEKNFFINLFVLLENEKKKYFFLGLPVGETK